ncbi:MAG: GGDEF domain-containing protein [Eubacterium sp.]|nr:GGDEF domain-containing protein [Eubacterium sp.]
MKKEIENELHRIVHKAVNSPLTSEDFELLCREMNVVKMYYDLEFDSEGYRGLGEGEEDTSKYRIFELYSEDTESDIKKKYTFYFDANEYVHAWIEFKKGITEEDIDEGICGFLADVVYLLVSRQNMRAMLDFSETHDSQTGIMNLKSLGAKYMQSIARYPEVEYVVLYANVKNFKFINDRGGVHLGDLAIAKIAQKLQEYMREDEGVCRVGGDNFAMFVRRDNLDVMLNRLKIVQVDGLMGLRNNSHRFSFRVGVSDTDIREFGTKLEEASTACVVAKTILKKDLVVFNMELSEIISHNNQIVAAFPDALAAGEFVPYFQPKVNMRTGELLGLEALCRWQHNDSIIAPAEFIPLLDRKGMIHDLDMTILIETCRCIHEWQEMGLKVPVVSVNFSKKNIFIPDIEKKIITAIRDNDISTSMLEIEITETAKESEIGRLIDFVRILKENGFKISIDDFGTGYSSLSLIHNINADEVKIDQSFVRKLGRDDKSIILIESIVSIANRLNMRIIAEGVENTEEGRMLMELGCGNAQGYYYGKPVDFEDMTKILMNPEFEALE